MTKARPWPGRRGSGISMVSLYAPNGERTAEPTAHDWTQ
jgi:hypothetical protein